MCSIDSESDKHSHRKQWFSDVPVQYIDFWNGECEHWAGRVGCGCKSPEKNDEETGFQRHIMSKFKITSFGEDPSFDGCNNDCLKDMWTWAECDEGEL